MKIKPNYKVRDIAGEKMVVMGGKEGVDLTKVIMLNSTGERLWSLLQGKEFTVDDAAEILTDSYGIGKQQAEKDAASWIDSLVKVGLIEV